MRLIAYKNHSFHDPNRHCVKFYYLALSSKQSHTSRLKYAFTTALYPHTQLRRSDAFISVVSYYHQYKNTLISNGPSGYFKISLKLSLLLKFKD